MVVRAMGAMGAVGATVLVLAGLAMPGPAAAEVPVSQTCTGGSPDFCLTYGVGVESAGTADPETRAAAPVDLSLDLANTSPAHGQDESRWLRRVVVDLLSSSGAGPMLTPSADLPDGLLIAGSAAGCGPGGDNSFSTCTAGYGSAVIHVAGTVFFDGYKTTTFGIQRITNVQATDALAEYQVDAVACVPVSGACDSQQAVTATLVVPQGGTTAGATLGMSVAGTVTFDGGGFPVVVRYSLDTFTLNLSGRSDQLADGGTADQLYDVLRMPATCGDVSAGGSATSDLATVAVPVSVPVTGCPTVEDLTATGVAPYQAAFSATAASPLERAVDGFVWGFGDGDADTTATGETTHTYPDSAARSVSVVAVDSAGARSEPVVVDLAGSRLTLKGKSIVAKGHRTRLRGALTSAGEGLADKKVRLLRCKKSGAACKRVARTTTSAGDHPGRYAFRVRVTRPAAYRVTFAGGPMLLGTRATKVVKTG